MSAKPTARGAESELRAIIQRWAKAVREEDVEGIRAHHDSNILMFDVPTPFSSRGLDAYMDTWKTFFGAAVRPITFDFEDIEIYAGEDVAFATAVGNCVYLPRGGGPTCLKFRLTMGFRKTDSEWLIVHEHHSVPATD
jgi:ketosteroid isomerase-like protein